MDFCIVNQLWHHRILNVCKFVLAHRFSITSKIAFAIQLRARLPFFCIRTTVKKEKRKHTAKIFKRKTRKTVNHIIAKHIGVHIFSHTVYKYQLAIAPLRLYLLLIYHFLAHCTDCPIIIIFAMRVLMSSLSLIFLKLFGEQKVEKGKYRHVIKCVDSYDFMLYTQ